MTLFSLVLTLLVINNQTGQLLPGLVWFPDPSEFHFWDGWGRCTEKEREGSGELSKRRSTAPFRPSVLTRESIPCRPTRCRILPIGKKHFVVMSSFFNVIGLFCLEYMAEDRNLEIWSSD